MAELITGNGGKLNFTEADKNETDKFVTAQFGKKFMTAFIDETQAFEPRKKMQ